ncbi:hypothetical protein HAX54_027213, partial [Datura stramonium]|nr:hypothetical protein [Datura stramonium]
MGYTIQVLLPTSTGGSLKVWWKKNSNIGDFNDAKYRLLDVSSLINAKLTFT